MRGSIRYQRELQKTYAVAEECEKELAESYFGRTALQGEVRGLAACSLHLIDGRMEVWYDISGLHTLEQVFAVKKAGFFELKELLIRLIQILKEAERYLIDGRWLCFAPAYLYMEMDTGELRLLFDFTEVCEENGIVALAEFLLEKTDHTDEQAVELAYYFYELAEKQRFSAEALEKRLTAEALSDQTGALLPEQNNPEQSLLSQPSQPLPQPSQPQPQPPQPSQPQPPQLRTQPQPSQPLQMRITGTLPVIIGGIGCILLALLLGGGFFAVQTYFILTEGEELLWILASVLLLAAGIVLGIYGFGREGILKWADKAGKKEAKERQEEWKEKEQEIQEAEEEDGRTIYIGSILAEKKYRLVQERQKGGKEYEITEFPFFIGKDKERVNLVLKERSVSRIHARLLQEGENIYIEDLHSTNGTCVNDLMLEPHVRVRIKRGDLLQFGKTELSLR